VIWDEHLGAFDVESWKCQQRVCPPAVGASLDVGRVGVPI
jgi:hypothetical protein